MEFGYFTLSDNHYENNTRAANQFVTDIAEEALHADKLGMHSAWIGEHHFNSLGVLSCPDLVLANDDGQRQIDVAASTSIDVSTLSRVVTRLVKMGLVTRTRSATNSREVVVRLTPKGAAVLARVIPHAIALERTAMAGVPAKDLGVVRRSLRRMYQNLAASAAIGARSAAPAVRASAASAAPSRRRRSGGRTLR